jgi:hypothetical protein
MVFRHSHEVGARASDSWMHPLAGPRRGCSIPIRTTCAHFAIIDESASALARGPQGPRGVRCSPYLL